MLDAHIYQLMLSLHEQLRDQKAVADEGVMLVHAMKRALLESVPGFDSAFDKHYQSVAAGPIGQRSAATLRELDALIVELRRLSLKS
jgi:hypothetical protein